MLDIELRRLIMDERVETLRRSASRRRRAVSQAPVTDAPGVELRLCKPADDPAIDRLAALSEQPVPFGRLVVALVDGEVVAAVSLEGGCLLRDPFRRTAHLARLLELRASQLRPPEPRRPLVPRLLRRHA
jgi:hypothetical protein